MKVIGISILIILGVWFIFSSSSNNSSSSYSLNNDYSSQCEEDISNYQDALEEANQNIDDVNYTIEDAKAYAWESYDEMGDALDSLQTIDTVDEPGYATNCEDAVIDYVSALEEANSNIEDANYSINDAQGYAWESYDEMGDALDSLQTIDTVDEP